MKIMLLISLTIMCDKLIFPRTFGISTENYLAVTCSSESECENSTKNGITAVNNSENIDDAIEFNDNNEWDTNIEDIHTIGITNVTSTTSTPTLLSVTQTPIATTTMLNNINESTITNLTSILNSIRKSNAEICTCDLTMSQCDINCCCDNDCTEFHLAIFSHCIDGKTKKYDSRYCYTKNFIQRNNTVFILEKLTDNLFCIAYDNLPPIYSKSNAIKIGNRKKFDEVMMKNVKQKFTWVQNKLFIPLNFNNSIPYRDRDVIWKIQSKSLKPMELPMSGFTSECTFRKNIQYLENFNSHCLQSNLSNGNVNLFSEIYSNFTVISSPIFYNITYISSLNEHCPKNICISIESKYCLNSTSLCDMMKPLTSSCVNGSCKNIVKSVHYIITHNGTMGIKKIQLNIELANVSKSFYQHFNVQYQWADINEQKINHRSGNPGYLIGKPIIIGTLKPNTTDDIVIGRNSSNTTNYYLTVPLAKRDGDCYENNRYIVNLGEDLKLKCRVTLKTNNFSINSCIQIHEKILTIFFEQSHVNFTNIEHYKTYVSKLGNISDGDNNNNVSNWDQILFNKVPHRILKSQKSNDRLRCSGLTTSLIIDILYSLLPKPDNIDNYKIVGIGVTLSDEEDLNWPKCLSPNCTDTLHLDLITYVKFHDISTPETHYYAGGPNLDISLPYDFFYPFLSSGSVHIELNLLILVTTIILLIYI